MNKRSFLKLLPTMAAPFLRPGWSPAAEQHLKNWSENFEFSTDQVLEPTTLEQVRVMVAKQSKIRPLGTRHCFNRIADSKHALLTVKGLDNKVALNGTARTVTVNGAMTYGALAPQLHAMGFALHNLASLPHISIAGACSTGTHGSGEKNGNLSTAVRGLEIVIAAGEILNLTRDKDSDTLGGAVVGLGALGVVTKLTLDVQPTYSVRQYVYENLPMAALKDHFDQIEAAAYSVSLFTSWQNHLIDEVWLKARTDVSGGPAGTPEFFGAKLAKRDLHPIRDLSAENCTEQRGIPGPWFDRLPHFRMGFTPSAGKELQSEFFVPRAHAIEAILAIERLRDQVSPHLLISEIRTIAADDLWLSPAYHRPSVAIHFTWKPDWPAVKNLLPIIERELGSFEPRPHWGKLFTLPPARIKGSYERWEDFLALSKRLDPNGKFRNEFLDANVFGA
jgi:alditol oxidase